MLMCKNGSHDYNHALFGGGEAGLSSLPALAVINIFTEHDDSSFMHSKDRKDGPEFTNTGDVG